MHEVTKVRRDVVRRELTVASKEFITPRMLRIVFASSDLAGFDSPSPDDHIKIFLPVSKGAALIMRDFTPRAWDVAAGTLTLDFALHEKGPAVEWATNCQAGDVLSIGGPRGSTIVPDDFDWYLMVGDATALPSIGRRLEALRPGVSVSVFALVADSAERQELPTQAEAKIRWLISSGAVQQDALLLRSAVEQFEAPQGNGFIWIATETSIARDLYECVVQARKQPKEWIKASGYWTADETKAG